MSVGKDRGTRRRTDIRGAGQGTGVARDMPAAGEPVARFGPECHAARARPGADCPMLSPAWEAVPEAAAE
jgi:nitronate monooxygenase